MKSRAFSATLFVAAALLCSCAGMLESIKASNERAKARQEAQAADGDDQAEPKATAGKQPDTGPHAPYEGKVKVALFVTFGGELWQDGMQDRAAEMLRKDLAAHAQFNLISEKEMQKLGKLQQPALDSAAWVDQVRGKFGKAGPQVLLHATLTSEEALGKNRSTGKIEKYPKFTAHTSYRHVRRDAAATFSKDGHVFANGNIMKEVVADFHRRTLTEIMPAK